jgi:hypothetical protein
MPSRRFFDFQPLGAARVKAPEPIRLYQLLASARSESVCRAAGGLSLRRTGVGAATPNEPRGSDPARGGAVTVVGDAGVGNPGCSTIKHLAKQHALLLDASVRTADPSPTSRSSWSGATVRPADDDERRLRR